MTIGPIEVTSQITIVTYYRNVKFLRGRDDATSLLHNRRERGDYASWGKGERTEKGVGVRVGDGEGGGDQCAGIHPPAMRRAAETPPPAYDALVHDTRTPRYRNIQTDTHIQRHYYNIILYV